MLRNAENKKKISIDRLADKVRGFLSYGDGAASDSQIMEYCEEVVFSESELALFSPEEKARIIRKVFCTLRCELEVLQDLADDPEVTEIMVNGPEDILIEKGSRTWKADVTFESQERLNQVIQRIAGRVGREFNDLKPIVDARLEDGSRINAVHSSIALGGPVLTIRKFAGQRLTMDQLAAAGDITENAAELLRLLTVCGYNIFVSGGTSSGKTTFLNILSDFIPPKERVIVIEDSAELQLRSRENLVRMETKAANGQGKGAVTMKELIKTSLRMRPDRIVVGEVRGPEVVDMLSAMSTGHDGSLSTGHGNSPAGMLGRLETMALYGGELPSSVIRSQIAEGIDIFVHLARTRDGHRRVIEIAELEGLSGGEFVLNTLYRYHPGQGLMPTGNSLKNTEKLLLRGGEEALDRLQNLFPRT